MIQNSQMIGKLVRSCLVEFSSSSFGRGRARDEAQRMYVYLFVFPHPHEQTFYLKLENNLYIINKG